MATANEPVDIYESRYRASKKLISSTKKKMKSLQEQLGVVGEDTQNYVRSRMQVLPGYNPANDPGVSLLQRSRAAGISGQLSSASSKLAKGLTAHETIAEDYDIRKRELENAKRQGRASTILTGANGVSTPAGGEVRRRMLGGT